MMSNLGRLTALLEEIEKQRRIADERATNADQRIAELVRENDRLSDLMNMAMRLLEIRERALHRLDDRIEELERQAREKG